MGARDHKKHRKISYDSFYYDLLCSWTPMGSLWNYLIDLWTHLGHFWEPKWGLVFILDFWTLLGAKMGSLGTLG